MPDTVLLVSGIGRRNHLLRLLTEECHTRGIEVVGCDASPQAAARWEVARFEVLPFASDPTYERAYARVLEKHEPIAYLTLLDPEITALGMLSSSAPFSDAAFLHPSWGTATVCEDKFTFAKHLESRGLPGIPTFLSPIDTFPQIRKDRRGSGASGFCIYPDPGSLPRDANDASFVYQPLRTDRYFCIDAYYSMHTGELVDCCVKEVTTRKNGESLVVRTVSREPFLDLLRGVAEALPLRGIVNFDIFGDEQNPALMEINCRISGNYPATHAFGVNLLEHMLREVVDGVTLEASNFSPYELDSWISSYPEFTRPDSPNSHVPDRAIPS